MHGHPTARDRGSPVSREDLVTVCDAIVWQASEIKEQKTEAQYLLRQIKDMTWGPGEFGRVEYNNWRDRWTVNTFRKAISHSNTVLAYASRRQGLDLTPRLERCGENAYRLEWGNPRRKACAQSCKEYGQSTQHSAQPIEQSEEGKTKGTFGHGSPRPIGALKVAPEELTRPVDVPATFPATLISAGSLAAGLTKQDWKNIIRQESISTRLLVGRKLPSFAECVAASVVFLPVDVNQKDAPFITGFAYNHFFQLSALISFATSADDAFVLAYYRSDEPCSLTRHTQGLSILWAVSYVYNLAKFAGSPMDRWMDQVRTDPDRAAEQFAAEVGSVLAELLIEKINLREQQVTIEPFAVVTRDERKLTTGLARVYTQYVFRVRLALDQSCAASARLLAGLAPGTKICLLPEKRMTRKELATYFSDKTTGRANLMDILAWESMFGTERQSKLNTATVTRRFAVV